jgi:hypothetical protein
VRCSCPDCRAPDPVAQPTPANATISDSDAAELAACVERHNAEDRRIRNGLDPAANARNVHQDRGTLLAILGRLTLEVRPDPTVGPRAVHGMRWDDRVTAHTAQIGVARGRASRRIQVDGAGLQVRVKLARVGPSVRADIDAAIAALTAARGWVP